MKTCPFCRTPYPHAEDLDIYCTKDGSELVIGPPSGFASQPDTKILPGKKYESPGSNPGPEESRFITTEMMVCPDKWLHEAADYQKEVLEYYFVKVDKALIQQHDLLRGSPYIDFKFVVSNYSVYKIFLSELSGSICYAGRSFSESPGWVSNPVNNFGVGEAECVIKQPLDREDVAFILNMGGSFEFSELKIRIKDTPNYSDVTPRYLAIRQAIDHQELHKAYPPLEMEIRQVQLKAYARLAQPDVPFSPAKELGSVVNVEVHFENPRERAVEIQSFKLNTDPNITRITPAVKGEIYENPQYSFENERLNNLNECPLHADQRHPFDGWLQFILIGVEPKQLEGATPTLIIVDSFGQEHRRGCPALKRG